MLFMSNYAWEQQMAKEHDMFVSGHPSYDNLKYPTNS